jgi:hypothetical protein
MQMPHATCPPSCSAAHSHLSPPVLPVVVDGEMEGSLGRKVRYGTSSGSEPSRGWVGLSQPLSPRSGNTSPLFCSSLAPRYSATTHSLRSAPGHNTFIRTGSCCCACLTGERGGAARGFVCVCQQFVKGLPARLWLASPRVQISRLKSAHIIKRSSSPPSSSTRPQPPCISLPCTEPATAQDALLRCFLARSIPLSANDRPSQPNYVALRPSAHGG